MSIAASAQRRRPRGVSVSVRATPTRPRRITCTATPMLSWTRSWWIASYAKRNTRRVLAWADTLTPSAFVRFTSAEIALSNRALPNIRWLRARGSGLGAVAPSPQPRTLSVLSFRGRHGNTVEARV